MESLTLRKDVRVGDVWPITIEGTSVPFGEES